MERVKLATGLWKQSHMSALSQGPTDLSEAGSPWWISVELVIYNVKPLRVVSLKKLLGNISTTEILVCCLLYQTYLVQVRDAVSSICI